MVRVPVNTFLYRNLAFGIYVMVLTQSEVNVLIIPGRRVNSHNSLLDGSIENISK